MGSNLLGASDSLRTSIVEPTSYRLSEPANGSMAPGLGLAPDAAGIAPGLLADGDPLAPTSFSSRLASKYLQWEANLADSRSLVNVNGVSVYPLVEINYAGWRLPISLYISSRDSAPR
ncbi:MAG: hypothetical protein ACREQC_08905 [Candidatus Binataceae bacterium]